MKDSLYKGFVAAPGGFLAGALYYISSVHFEFSIFIFLLCPIIYLHLILIDRLIDKCAPTKITDDEKITFWKILVILVMPLVVLCFFYLGLFLFKLLNDTIIEIS
ncbi:MAG: hypothetical protein LBE13_14520 [Bacteroidales bacterium]|jgi:hypothetical protein|nr:hypothetical protein [Bacteroidales bacterium]